MRAKPLGSRCHLPTAVRSQYSPGNEKQRKRAFKWKIMTKTLHLKGNFHFFRYILITKISMVYTSFCLKSHAIIL